MNTTTTSSRYPPTFPLTGKFLQRAATFWSYLDITGNPDECWEWQQSRNQSGYGYYRFNGPTWRAHRLAWFLTHHSLSADLVVRHTCDNPPCCNPNHLIAGTHLENVADAIKRNRRRAVHGSSHYSAKLDERLVRIIKKRLQNNERPVDLGREFNVASQTIGKIKKGKIWKHVI